MLGRVARCKRAQEPDVFRRVKLEPRRRGHELGGGWPAELSGSAVAEGSV